MRSFNFDQKAHCLNAPGGKLPPIWAVKFKLNNNQPAFFTAWKPDEREQILLGAGDPIYLMIVGNELPLMTLTMDKPTFNKGRGRIIKPGDADYQFIPSKLLRPSPRKGE